MTRALSEERALLLGGYFTHEYSLEAAALFNPSIVPHPDQSDLPPGSLRFILSLRATGEGHISSITFRTGRPGRRRKHHDRRAHPLQPRAGASAQRDLSRSACSSGSFSELNLVGAFSREVLKGLGDTFTLEELRTSISLAVKQLRAPDLETEKVARKTLMLAQSYFEVQFDAGLASFRTRAVPRHTLRRATASRTPALFFFKTTMARGLITPLTRPMTAKMIQPQFLETPDFLHFKFITLNGPAVENKGMALFPRKIKGLYAMLGRQDSENIYVMFSDHLHFWHTMQLVLEPSFPWEFIQLGNCGSPIETEAGWLVLSHGVGPMRKYCIGAFLLDLDDPTKVIGRLREPLIEPNEDEREGYVPNVVYSCGSLLHGRQLIIPYGMSDYATTFATVPLDEVLAAME